MGGNDLIAEYIQNDWRKVDLAEVERAMLEWAEKLTITPSAMTQDDIQKLRKVGWTDRDILDIAHVSAYFNYRRGTELPQASGAWSNRLRVRRRLRAAADTTSSKTPRLERDASRSGGRPLHNRCRFSEDRNPRSMHKGRQLEIHPFHPLPNLPDTSAFEGEEVLPRTAQAGTRGDDTQLKSAFWRHPWLIRG